MVAGYNPFPSLYPEYPPSHYATTVENVSTATDKQETSMQVHMHVSVSVELTDWLTGWLIA